MSFVTHYADVKFKGYDLKGGKADMRLGRSRSEGYRYVHGVWNGV